ncbi:hypothetical protein LQ948_09740 [Jiella sp. MQZ9-1]|uniref:DUF3426 domain-containing protein n=1 Tax=Jiella flava TaxID=2816857 RepID=A0A939FZH5_9HYPH|nr:hypothetical protein [Jiella flava]MBO0663070.1 hypothetical protein [Jiella flava]MCD2471489.1 hypothetical protein [Jiella flava]
MTVTDSVFPPPAAEQRQIHCSLTMFPYRLLDERAEKHMRRQDDSALSPGTVIGSGPPLAPGTPCIEGVAEVTARRSLDKSAARSAIPAADSPTRDFGQRRRSAADTPQSAKNHTDPHADANHRTLPGSTPPWQRLATGRFAVLAAAVAVGAPLVPALLVAFPKTPIAATVVDEPQYAVQLGTVEASLKQHGDRKMLEISGRIANPGRSAAAIPPLQISFADPKQGLRSRTLQTSVAQLPAGQTLDFISKIAMPEDANGTVRIGFVGSAMKGDL